MLKNVSVRDVWVDSEDSSVVILKDGFQMDKGQFEVILKRLKGIQEQDEIKFRSFYVDCILRGWTSDEEKIHYISLGLMNAKGHVDLKVVKIFKNVLFA